MMACVDRENPLPGKVIPLDLKKRLNSLILFFLDLKHTLRSSSKGVHFLLKSIIPLGYVLNFYGIICDFCFSIAICSF